MIGPKKNRKVLSFLKWLAPIFLISSLYIFDPRYFLSPPLRSDDWEWLVWRFIFDPLELVNWADRRPFISSLLSVLTPLLGLNIQWYYLVNFLLILLSGIILFLIIKRTFSQYTWLALPVTLIFLVYPTNFAKTWLIVLNIHLSLILALTAILMMIEFARSGKILLLLSAILFFILSLGIYEAGLGIVMLAAFILCFLVRDLPVKRRIPIISVMITGAGFIIWRTLIQPVLMNVQDHYLETIAISFTTIINRYVQGLFIFLFNWTGPLLNSFGRAKYWVFVGVGIILLIVFLFTLPRLIKSAKSSTSFPYDERKKNIKSLLIIFMVGGLFWAAGYVPVISLYQPIFYGDGSRVNYFSVPGASLSLVAGIACLITLTAQSKERIKRTLIIAIIPLLVLGSVFQIHAQNERFRVWKIKKEFWHSMFEAVTGLENRTKVVIVIPGYEDLEPFEMYPFAGDWEAESALRVLYNSTDLFAEYYYRDIPDYSDNWVPTDADLSRYVFVFYDPNSATLTLIEDPGQALSLPLQMVGYDPEQRITPYNSEVETYRWLVD